MLEDPGIGESAAEILIQTFHHCLKDTRYLQSVITSLDSDDLPDRDLKWVYRQIVDVWTKHHEAVPRLVLERRAARSKRGSEEKLELIAKVFDDDEEGYPRLALEELNNWLRTRRLHIALVEATEAIEKDPDRAYEAVGKAVVRDARPTGVRIVDWFGELDERQAKRLESSDDPFRTVPTGFAKIDEALDGGVARGELALMLAPTARGKSMILVHSGFKAAAMGFQVTHVTLEMSEYQVATRYDARWSRLSARLFKNFDFEPEQLEVLDAKKRLAAHKLNGRVQIVHVPVHQCDGNTLRSIMTSLKDRGIEGTDLLIVDSADHMRSVRKFEAFRHEQAAVYWDLKALAQELDCAIITSTHASKEWADRLIKAEGAAESYDKSRIADIIISINRSKTKGREDVKRFLDLYLAKYRDGEDKFLVPVKVDRPTMFFEELAGEDDDGEEGGGGAEA